MDVQIERCEFCGAEFQDRGWISAAGQINAHMLFGGCEQTKAASDNLLRSLADGPQKGKTT